MTKENGTMPQFEFDLDNITAGEMDILIKGRDITEMAGVMAKIVSRITPDCGPVDDPETYRALRWKVWRGEGGLIDQIGTAAKNG
jgi:hypothetical protein